MSGAESENGRFRMSSPVKAILYGTVIAGVLDSLDAVVFYGIHGKGPIAVLQYIATGLIGPGAFEGGLPTAALGAGMHFAIALLVAAVYVLASTRIQVLRSHAVLAGLTYGAAVWVVMNLVILPLTPVFKMPLTTAGVLNGLVGHALLVGLPIALCSRRFFSPKTGEAADGRHVRTA